MATSISEGSTVNDSSDDLLEDEDYAFTSEEAQSILREWSADQPASMLKEFSSLRYSCVRLACQDLGQQKSQQTIPPPPNGHSGGGTLTFIPVVETLYLKLGSHCYKI